jgi:hypothetical protein
MGKWSVCGCNIEFIDKFNYLGITLENTGDWNQRQAQQNKLSSISSCW